MNITEKFDTVLMRSAGTQWLKDAVLTRLSRSEIMMNPHVEGFTTMDETR